MSVCLVSEEVLVKVYPPFNENSMVVAYYRYSSSSQNEESIEQQREMVQR